MKFCYCDESGTGNEPIAVMVGIVVDAQRMHLTKDDWATLLDTLSSVVGRSIPELHTRDFYAGNGLWRSLDGKQRSRVITQICDWLSERKHRLVYSAVVKATYAEGVRSGDIPDELNTPWRFLGFHMVLALQRTLQRLEKNKGNTVFVFDNEEWERLRFTDLIQRPPNWSDTYYDRGKKQKALDQVIDVPYFADSRDVGLLQLADVAAYFLRRFAEIEEGRSKPKYEDEREKVSAWAQALRERALDRASLYPAKGRTEAMDLFYRYAPTSIRAG